MKNRSESVSQNEASQEGKAPKLRFPEFRDAPEWQNRRIGYFLIGQSREIKKPDKPYTGLGIRSHGKGTFLKKFQEPEKNSMDRLYTVESNDLVVNITFAWEGAIAIANDCDHGALVSHRFPTYTFNPSKANSDFVRQIITTKDFVYKLFLISPGGAGRNRVMNKKDFLDIKIFLPELEEQQKIAECLSSLDELISAHTQKLDTLKAHKKGLMQQLFPEEGETVPKLRFSEFRDAHEWEEKFLGKEATIVMGASPKSEFYNEDRNGLPLLQGNTDIKNRISAPRIFTSQITKECQKGDILLSVRAPVGTVAKSIHHACIGRGMAAIRVKNDNSQEFLYQWLLSFEPRWQNISQGGTFDAVNSDAIRNLITSLPSETEQQKIADCLSSLDELITAQTQKLDRLKTHKKGLMQQLFPSADEMTG